MWVSKFRSGSVIGKTLLLVRFQNEKHPKKVCAICHVLKKIELYDYTKDLGKVVNVAGELPGR